MKTFKTGGIHPSAEKFTSETPIRAIKEPAMLTLQLQQGIGKPSKAIVKVGDKVEAGQLIAEADGLISSNLHAPRGGKVVKIAKVRGQQGYWQDAVTIECDPDAPRPQYTWRSDTELASLSPADIIEAIRAAGIVGMGGAAFPTAVKLMPPPGTDIDILIINGAECEPYLTCDDRLMRERPEGILLGAAMLMRAIGVKRCVVGIEDNKPEAIAAMRTVAEGMQGIEIAVLRTKYPQGGEKQLIAAITGKEVPSGKLPASVGAIVDNVATAYAVYEAVYYGKPLIDRVVTVTGRSLTSPGNFLAPIGVSINDLLAAGGGLPEDGRLEIIGGGPMMGRDVSDTEAPSLKGTSGLTVMSGEEISRRDEQPCIRCGRCLHGCPMGLEPYLLIALARHKMWQEMKDNMAMDCIECGSCSWSCPAEKPLLDFIKLGKLEIRKQKL